MTFERLYQILVVLLSAGWLGVTVRFGPTLLRGLVDLTAWLTIQGVRVKRTEAEAIAARVIADRVEAGIVRIEASVTELLRRCPRPPR